MLVGAFKPKHVVDTHRHVLGPKLIAKMLERGLYDPKPPLPQAAAGDVIIYREVVDLDYAMLEQREGGVTLSLDSNGGKIEWLARDILQTSTSETLRFLNEEYTDAHSLDESCRAPAEYGYLSRIGNEVSPQRSDRAPYDSAVTIARMIGSGIFDRHPKLQVVVVHMGGDLSSILGRLDFCWKLNYHGVEEIRPPRRSHRTSGRHRSDPRGVERHSVHDPVYYEPVSRT